MVKIAPSLLAADFSNISADILRCEEAGADLFHVDVMDGHYVQNITLGPLVVKGIRKAASIPLNVHLMITNPERFAEAYCEAGADTLVCHIESPGDTGGALRIAREMGVKTGIALNPETHTKATMDLLPLVDEVTIMSVHPGFGGQTFMAEVLEKIPALRSRMRGDAEILIDGGINAETAPRARDAGCDILVAGTALFGAADLPSALADLRG